MNVIKELNDDISIPIEKRLDNIIINIRSEETYQLAKFLWDIKSHIYGLNKKTISLNKK